MLLLQLLTGFVLYSVVRKVTCLENARPVVEEVEEAGVEDAAVVDLEGEDLMIFSKYQNKKSHA